MWPRIILSHPFQLSEGAAELDSAALLMLRQLVKPVGFLAPETFCALIRPLQDGVFGGAWPGSQESASFCLAAGNDN